MTFNDCVLECCKSHELIKGFNRLTKRNVLTDTRPPIVRMIDASTGYQKELDKKAHEDMQVFMTFIFEVIWMPLVINVRSGKE